VEKMLCDLSNLPNPPPGHEELITRYRAVLSAYNDAKEGKAVKHRYDSAINYVTEIHEPSKLLRGLSGQESRILEAGRQNTMGYLRRCMDLSEEIKKTVQVLKRYEAINNTQVSLG
jgi:hypothetical protein